jgi:hypothetical protein
MAVRKAEIFAPVTLAHIRSHGCRDLLVYCDSGRCHHSALRAAFSNSVNSSSLTSTVIAS